MSRYTASDVIAATCRVYGCKRELLVSCESAIYQRRREIAVAAAVRLGIAPTDIGRPLGMDRNRASDVVDSIDMDAISRPNIINPIINSIVDAVRRRLVA